VRLIGVLIVVNLLWKGSFLWKLKRKNVVGILLLVLSWGLSWEYWRV